MEKRVIMFLLSAVFLYLAGVLTGAYLGSMSALNVTIPIKSKAADLENKVNQLERTLSTTLNGLYILQFVSDKRLVCNVASNTLGPVLSEIASMVKYLPPRLEIAEIPSKLEDQYTSLNVRAFLTADYLYRNCGSERIPILYIYEHGELNAGYLIDRIRKDLSLMVFVAWGRSSDPFIKALNPKTPSVYVCGRLVSPEDVEQVVKQC